MKHIQLQINKKKTNRNKNALNEKGGTDYDFGVLGACFVKISFHLGFLQFLPGYTRTLLMTKFLFVYLIPTLAHVTSFSRLVYGCC